MKHVIDLVIKITRMNKDRMLEGQLTELLRGLKGIENDLLLLLQARTALTNENAKLKREAKAQKPFGVTQQLERLLEMPEPEPLVRDDGPESKV